MSDYILALIVLGFYGIVAILIILIWIFIDPTEDLCEICEIGLIWPLALISLVTFLPFKLLEMLQKNYSRKGLKRNTMTKMKTDMMMNMALLIFKLTIKRNEQ